MKESEIHKDKKFRKELQKEMMWFVGIHIYKNARAEMSFELNKMVKT